MLRSTDIHILPRKYKEVKFFKLTHDLNFQCSACAVTLRVACYASVSRLIAHSLNILDDECAVGEDLLLSVDRQDSGISLPDNTVDRVSSDWTCDA